MEPDTVKPDTMKPDTVNDAVHIPQEAFDWYDEYAPR